MGACCDAPRGGLGRLATDLVIRGCLAAWLCLGCAAGTEHRASEPPELTEFASVAAPPSVAAAELNGASPQVTAASSDAGALAAAPEADPPEAKSQAPEEVSYPFQEPLPPHWLPKAATAMRHANLSPAQCRRELNKRKLPFKPARPSSGIAYALHFDGEIDGVRFLTAPKRSPYGRLDCRLALTLADLAALLRQHEVKSLRVDNMYRPNARLPGSRRKSQHNYGLAIDITAFTLSDGTVLSVEDDWGSELGSVPCGPEAKLDAATEKSIRLRNLLCDVVRAQIFHHLLTPSHDRAHRDHFHLDIKRDAKSWMLD